MSYNILVSGRRRLHSIASVLRQLEPDLIILQEAFRRESVEHLARALDIPAWYAHGKQSLAVISKLPIRQVRWHITPVSKRAFLEVRLPELTVFGVHLQPYFFRRSERQRLREVQALLAMLVHYRELPHIIIGDFNSIAPGEVANLRRMPLWVGALLYLTGGQFESHSLRALLQAGYVDVYRTLYPHQNGFTFPALTPQIRVDYLFAPPMMLERVRECAIVSNHLTRRASDHCPLLAVVDIRQTPPFMHGDCG